MEKLNITPEERETLLMAKKQIEHNIYETRTEIKCIILLLSDPRRSVSPDNKQILQEMLRMKEEYIHECRQALKIIYNYTL